MTGPAKNKALGQHFLREPRIARRIVEAADMAPGHRVLEVGPGDGVLTEVLRDAVGPDGHVVAWEADDRFADLIDGKDWSNVTVRRGDAVQADLGADGPYDRIVANLPYQVSGPITVAFLGLLREQGWGKAVLMYQREFAERLLAGPGSKTYGRLSVHTARWCRVEKVRDVPPGCFDPPPKVHSTVVALTPHPEPPFVVTDETVWRAVVDGAFQQRRKQLKNTVPGAVAALGVPKEAAVAAVADEGLATERPEQVAPAAFAALVARLAEARP